MLLPLPEAPIIARNWPRGMENVTSRRISTRFGGFSMIFQSWLTSMTLVWAVAARMSILRTWGDADSIPLLQSWRRVLSWRRHAEETRTAHKKRNARKPSKVPRIPRQRRHRRRQESRARKIIGR